MLWRLLALVFLSGILFVGHGAAGAQDRAIAGFYQVWSGERTLDNLRKQASCAVERYPVDARRIVVEDMDMATMITSMQHLTKPCFSAALFKDNTFSITQPVYGYALAEVLIRRLIPAPSLARVAEAPTLPREMVPQQDFSNFPRRLRESIAHEDALVKLDAASECVARRSASDAYSLVTSKPHSVEEGALMTRLHPVINSCKGITFGVDPSTFFWRGAIAASLYRLLDALRVEGNTKG